MGPADQHHLETLLERSERLAGQAENIMTVLRVRELWGRLGRVVLVGSARYGLLNTPNIDFEIYVEQPDAAAGAAIMAEIAAAPGVTGLVHHDFMGTSDPGLYWRLDYLAEDGECWDFDIWLVPFSHPFAGLAEAFAQAMEQTLTPETRLTILRLKAELAARAAKSKTSRPRGIDICKAVLHGGVRDAEDFDAWRRLNQPPEMETWRPGRKDRPQRPKGKSITPVTAPSARTGSVAKTAPALPARYAAQPVRPR